MKRQFFVPFCMHIISMDPQQASKQAGWPIPFYCSCENTAYVNESACNTLISIPDNTTSSEVSCMQGIWMQVFGLCHPCLLRWPGWLERCKLWHYQSLGSADLFDFSALCTDHLLIIPSTSVEQCIVALSSNAETILILLTNNVCMTKAEWK